MELVKIIGMLKHENLAYIYKLENKKGYIVKGQYFTSLKKIFKTYGTIWKLQHQKLIQIESPLN